MKLRTALAAATATLALGSLGASAAQAAIPAPPAVPPISRPPVSAERVTITPGTRWIAPRIDTNAVYAWAGPACRSITPAGTYLAAYGAAGKVINPPYAGMPGTVAYGAICQYANGSLRAIAHVKPVNGSTGTIQLARYNDRPVMSSSTGTVAFSYHAYKQGVGGKIVADTIVAPQPSRAY